MINAIATGTILSWLYDTVCMLPGIIIGLAFHEFAHAWVADKCGDPTPRAMGRVSINPKAHIDLYGFICLMLIHFGWGKPVMINPSYFKHKRADCIKVGIAGVAMNFILGTVFGLALRFALISPLVSFLFFTQAGQVICDIWLDIIVINYGLMFFNLLPVPPLDGFGLLTDIFGLRGGKFYMFMRKNSMLIILLLILFDIPSMIISPLLNRLVRFVCFSGF